MMRLIKLLLNFLYYVLCVLASGDGREGMVLVLFNEIGMLNRTGDTGPDTVNFLRCLVYTNVSTGGEIYISDDNILTLVYDQRESVDFTAESEIWNCWSVFAFSLTLLAGYNDSEYGDGRFVGAVDDLISNQSVNRLNGLRRNVRLVNVPIDPQGVCGTIRTPLT
jgi:hypothetical protein